MLDSLNLDQIQNDLEHHYHQTGPGRKQYRPLTMLKAQLAKHLLRIPSDRRLALRLRNARKVARACGFRRRTPSHGLFTHFRHRLGEKTYLNIFNKITRILRVGDNNRQSRRHRQHTHQGLQRKSHGQPHRQKRPRRPGRAWKERLHPRLPSAHGVLRRLRATTSLHRRPMQRERQAPLRASAGAGTPPWSMFQIRSR